MNPFSVPDRILINPHPQDMRAGIQRLAATVTADFEVDPADGTLYAFVSRDLEKMKLLRFETNGWCMYYVRLCEGGFKWNHTEDGQELLSLERRELTWLLEGLDLDAIKAATPLTQRSIL